MSELNFETSFDPIIGPKPKVLILGTLPGKRSLQLQQYYGHPRNQFWPILFAIHNQNNTTEYNSKIKFLKQNGIALWDICHQAIRKSSLDIDIKQEVPNRIHELIKVNPSIKTIAFNGQKAEKLYRKYFTPLPDIKYHTLLSTSPANATYSYKEKMDNWLKILS